MFSNFSETDARRKQFANPGEKVVITYDTGDRQVPDYTNLKFKKVAGWEADYVFMRLSEAYLTEAEALAHLNKNGEAASVLKELMVNRDPSWNKTSVTVDEVYTQRRLELWGEGFSFFDHLRLKKDIIRNYEGSNHWVGGRLDFKAGDWTLLYQIPRPEFQENDQMDESEQNP